MRILHILDHSIPLQSGYAFRTRSILREQRRIGWETFQLTSPKHAAPSSEVEDIEDLRFYRTLWRPRGIAELPIVRLFALMRALETRIEQIADEVHPDVIHAHSPVLNAVPALAVGRRRNIPVVYEVRAFWEDAAVDHGTAREGGIRYRLTRSLETFAMKRADHVTTICEGLRTDIVARGIPSGRVTVVPNAVDVAEFHFRTPRDVELRRSLGLEDKVVVGFVGSFYAYEGLDLLIDALPEMLAGNPDIRLLLVGGGPHERELRALATRLGLADKIVMTGRVSHVEVPRYYSVVDVLAYPRRSMRLTELVTPLKPLEAMAQGQLVVASDVGGHREIIEDDRTGTLFRAGDAKSLARAVLRLLGARSVWEERRQVARRYVESERTWPRSVARYADVYRAVARSNPVVA